MEDNRQFDCDQYLTFSLGSELFGINIDSVREIVEVPNITRIPRTLRFMRGVINLRGHAVPVVDLRHKFGMPPTEPGVDTCVIISEVILDDETTLIGALADSVQEVMEIGTKDIDETPKMGTAIDPRYIKGISNIGKLFVIILDVATLFSLGELTISHAVEHAKAS